MRLLGVSASELMIVAHVIEYLQETLQNRYTSRRMRRDELNPPILLEHDSVELGPSPLERELP